MRCLTLQIDLSKVDDFDEALLLDALKVLGRSPEIDRGEGDDRSVYFNLFTEQLPQLWQSLQEHLFDGSLAPVLRKAAIVYCDGDDESEEGLLLFHFDDSEVIDRL